MVTPMYSLFVALCFLSPFVASSGTSFTSQASFEAQPLLYLTNLNFTNMGLYNDPTRVFNDIATPFTPNTNFTAKCGASYYTCLAWTGQSKAVSPPQGLNNADYAPGTVGIGSYQMQIYFPPKSVNAVGGRFFIVYAWLSQNYPYIFPLGSLVVAAYGNNDEYLGDVYVSSTTPPGVDNNPLSHYFGFTSDKYIRFLNIYVQNANTLTIVTSFFQFGATPYECESNCDLCDLEGCLQCQNNWVTLNGVCVESCPEGFRLDQPTQTCVKCDTQCKTCEEAGSCTSCNPGYYSYRSACLQTCPTGTFAQQIDTGSEMLLFCFDCISGCDVCSDYSTCDTCGAATPINFGGQCQASCPPGTIPFFSTCQACIEHCHSCTNTYSCDVCNFEFYIYYDNACRQSCPVGTYYNGVTCVSCIEGCDSCSDTSGCDACAEYNPIYYNNTCWSECPAGTRQVGATCEVPPSVPSSSPVELPPTPAPTPIPTIPPPTQVPAGAWMTSFALTGYSAQWLAYNGAASNLLPQNNPTASTQAFWNAANNWNQYYPPYWVSFDLGASYTVSKFEFKATGDGTHDPSTFSLQYSSSASGPYSVAQSFQGASGSANMQVFTLSVPQNARYWKFNIDNSYSYQYQVWVAYVNFFVQ